MPRIKHTVESPSSTKPKSSCVKASSWITQHTYYRRRNKNGSLKIDQVKRLKELERENSRLKRAVAHLTLDQLILILKKAAEGRRSGECLSDIQPGATRGAVPLAAFSNLLSKHSLII